MEWRKRRFRKGNRTKNLHFKPLIEKPGDEFERLSVFLMPTRNERIQMNFSVELKDYTIRVGEPESKILSVCSPLVFRYNHKESITKRVRVHIKREEVDLVDAKEVSSGCTIVSVQRLDKPTQMSQGGSISNGWWQTMLSQSVIDVDVGPDARFFKKGFHIVAQRVINERMCTGMEDENDDDFEVPKEVGCGENDKRNIRVNVEIDEVDNDTTKGSLFVIAVFVIIILFYLFWGFYMVKNYGYEENLDDLKRKVKDGNDNLTNPGVSSIAGLVRNGKILGYQRKSKVHEFLDVEDETKTVAQNEVPEETPNENPQNNSKDDDYLSMLNAEMYGNRGDKDIIPALMRSNQRIYNKINAPKYRHDQAQKRLKELRLSDMSYQCDIMLFLRGLEMKSSLYCWMLFLSGIFYFLPTIQLVYSEHKISKQTRSQDLCYYNFLCRSTVWLPLLGTINDWGELLQQYCLHLLRCFLHYGCSSKRSA